ncbi:hypothetical protein HMPREF9103_00935 [Lentilactobacillus parafarraginis F0439]|uniref:Uncharacterized protein n=1 Tax=Lentilactobacillus parafarraginis F0439 TaxID=797515 RepID=G9ZMI6_9LACO|nr:hypothetical protein HMPREF9103_00935 [Lentilactobacillus parafarraginis F0439]
MAAPKPFLWRFGNEWFLYAVWFGPGFNLTADFPNLFVKSVNFA